MSKRSELLVTEREFIKRLTMITGYDKDIVRDVIKAQSDFVFEELANGIPVRVGKLGEFSVKTANCQGGFNFATGEKMPIKQRARVKFRVSKGLRDVVHESFDQE